MFGTQTAVVHTLRTMALGGSKPSDMLRVIISAHPSEMPTRTLFYQYFTEAFCFAEGEASLLYGWLPDQTGELKDSNIDCLLTKRIQKNREVWETTP